MRILAIGGCGYIGSMLVPMLLKNNHIVHVLDSLVYGQTSLLNICYHKNFSITIGDCRDESLISSLVSKYDVIIMLAAIVGSPQCEAYPHEAKTVNVDAVQNLVKHLSPTQQILYPCSNSGYGVGEDDIFCTEETPLHPVSLYGRTKVEAETILLDRDNSISLRLATVFGSSPCMRVDLLVNNFVFRAFHDRYIVLFESHFKRNYIHIRDVARAFILCIDNFENMRDNIYNVGLSSANLSKKELCERIQKYIDFVIIENELMEDPDRRNYIVSNEKIEKCGFSPEFTIDDGIRELIKTYMIIKKPYYINS